jgi:hypothetical protein
MSLLCQISFSSSKYHFKVDPFRCASLQSESVEVTAARGALEESFGLLDFRNVQRLLLREDRRNATNEFHIRVSLDGEIDEGTVLQGDALLKRFFDDFSFNFQHARLRHSRAARNIEGIALVNPSLPEGIHHPRLAKQLHEVLQANLRFTNFHHVFLRRKKHDDHVCWEAQETQALNADLKLGDGARSCCPEFNLMVRNFCWNEENQPFIRLIESHRCLQLLSNFPEDFESTREQLRRERESLLEYCRPQDLPRLLWEVESKVASLKIKKAKER